MDDIFTNKNHIVLDELNQTDLSWLHDQGYNGTGLKIGIMDNGIDFLHEAFTNINFTEKSFDTPDQQSTQTHGTPVSGVIVGYEEGNVNGTAPGSTIVSAEMGSNPQDTQLFGNFTAAMEWFAEQNVTVVNMSFGGIEDWTSMIDIAKQNDIIIVGSAGNDGEDYPPSGPGTSRRLSNFCLWFGLNRYW
jgi:subtilisin family serine protease